MFVVKREVDNREVGGAGVSLHSLPQNWRPFVVNNTKRAQAKVAGGGDDGDGYY